MTSRFFGPHGEPSRIISPTNTGPAQRNSWNVHPKPKLARRPPPSPRNATAHPRRSHRRDSMSPAQKTCHHRGAEQSSWHPRSPSFRPGNRGASRSGPSGLIFHPVICFPERLNAYLDDRPTRLSPTHRVERWHQYESDPRPSFVPKRPLVRPIVSLTPALRESPEASYWPTAKDGRR